jgi:hypothetical protein
MGRAEDFEDLEDADLNPQTVSSRARIVAAALSSSEGGKP